MAFCTKCGKPATGSSLFCTSCGAPLKTETVLARPQEPSAGPVTTASEPVPGAADTNPLGQFGIPQPPPEPGMTVTAGLGAGAAVTSPTGMAPPPPPTWPGQVPLPGAAPVRGPVPVPVPGPVPGPGPAPGPPRSSGSRTKLIVGAVVLVVLAAGGGVAAADLLHRGNGSPGAQGTGAPQASTPATSPGGSPSASGAPSALGSSSPVTSPVVSSSAPTPSGSGIVTVAPGVSGSTEPAVVDWLNEYFNAINTLHYQRFLSLLDAQQQSTWSRYSFRHDYSTTQDSDITLVSLTGGESSPAATFTFTSHQNPAFSNFHTNCTNWELTFYLEQGGSGYIWYHQDELSSEPCS